jgi:hypothetical protein
MTNYRTFLEVKRFPQTEYLSLFTLRGCQVIPWPPRRLPSYLSERRPAQGLNRFDGLPAIHAT